MSSCLIPNCTNSANNGIGIRLRRPNTTAIWAPNCNAFLCDFHASQGYDINIVLTAAPTRNITTYTSAGGNVKRRRTAIRHNP
jgi:hypothetical protein